MTGLIETGKTIANIRKQKNMTQKDLATQLNVSDKAVSKWERGESYPEITLLPKLAAILGISADELLTGRPTPAADHEKDDSGYSYQCLAEDCNQQYIRGTLISYAIISAALFSTVLMAYWGVIQVVPVALLLVAMVVFYGYDKKGQTSITRYRIFANTMELPSIQASCREVVFVATIQVAVLMGILSLRDIVINEKHILFFSGIQLLFLGMILSVFVIFLLFIKFPKSNRKPKLYVILSAPISLISTIALLFFQVYIKVSMTGINGYMIIINKQIQEKTNLVFLILLLVGLLYSLGNFLLKDISVKKKTLLFMLSAIPYSCVLAAARNCVWYGDSTTNVLASVCTGYIGLALLLCTPLYYISAHLSKRIE